MKGWKSALLDAYKAEATARLEAGEREFTIGVHELIPHREKGMLRMHINHWLRRNGWRGAVRFDRRESMFRVQVLERREES